MDEVDIDALTEKLSKQDFRSACGDLYKALAELKSLRAKVSAIRKLYPDYMYFDEVSVQEGDGVYAIRKDHVDDILDGE